MFTDCCGSLIPPCTERRRKGVMRFSTFVQLPALETVTADTLRPVVIPLPLGINATINDQTASFTSYVLGSSGDLCERAEIAAAAWPGITPFFYFFAILRGISLQAFQVSSSAGFEFALNRIDYYQRHCWGMIGCF